MYVHFQFLFLRTFICGFSAFKGVIFKELLREVDLMYSIFHFLYFYKDIKAVTKQTDNSLVQSAQKVLYYENGIYKIRLKKLGQYTRLYFPKTFS